MLLCVSSPQGWETTDPSLPSLGPLLQRTSISSSNPRLSHSRASNGSCCSTGSRSLISPTLVELYPRRSISSYCFRGASYHFSHKKEVLGRGRKVVHPTPKMNTTAIGDLPTGGMTRLVFPIRSSLGNGDESRVSTRRLQQSPATVWGSSPSLQDGAFWAKGNTDAEFGKEMQLYHFSEDGQTDYKSNPAMTLLSIPTVSSACRPDGRTMVRSNSLPNIVRKLGESRGRK